MLVQTMAPPFSSRDRFAILWPSPKSRAKLVPLQHSLQSTCGTHSLSDEYSPPLPGSNRPPQRPLSRDQTAVDVEVFLGHAARREPFFEDLSDPGSG